MYKKKKNQIKVFKQDSIVIRPISNVDEEYTIGNWNNYYPEMKLKYYFNHNVYPNYSVIMIDDNVVVGYFIATILVNYNEKLFIDKYSKIMMLSDLGVYSLNHKKHGKLLIDYLIELSKKCGCMAIEVKNIQGFGYFYDFLRKSYNLKEESQNYYLVNDEYKVTKTERYLKIYDDDNIALDNLYFLYGLKFRIGRNKCTYIHQGTKVMSVDRKSGIIELPSNVINRDKKILLTDRNRNLIHLLCNMYVNNNIKEILINKNPKTENVIDAYANDCVIVFDNPEFVQRNYQFLNRIYFTYGFDSIYAYQIEFDLNYLIFNSHCKMIDIKECLKSKIKYLDLKDLTLKETQEKLKELKLFNEKLEYIKRFEFRLGNSFAGIKKFTILFDDDAKIIHNGRRKNYQEIGIDKKAFLNELKELSFSNWKGKYINENPDYDYAWMISLIFEDEIIIYEGLDEYPNVWIFVIEIIEKYSSLVLREKQELF